MRFSKRVFLFKLTFSLRVSGKLTEKSMFIMSKQKETDIPSRLIADGDPSIQTNSKSTTPRIVACIDGSRLSKPVCDYACWLAKKNHQPLKLLHTIEQLVPLPNYDLSGALSLGASEELLSELTDIEAKRRKLLVKQGQLILDAMQEYAAENIEGVIQLEQRHGAIGEVLIAQEADIEMVVMGVRGEAHETDEGLGAHLDSTIRSLHRPILVVNGDFSIPTRVLLAHDGSEPSNKALDFVSRHPMFEGLMIHLVYVSQHGPSENETKRLHDAKNRLIAAGRSVEAEILQGKIQEALIRYQSEREINLTVMGAYSHHRFRHFLMGSFTANMLKVTQQPILLVH